MNVERLEAVGEMCAATPKSQSWMEPWVVRRMFAPGRCCVRLWKSEGEERRGKSDRGREMWKERLGRSNIERATEEQ
jgi:hypothetical protein